MITRLKISKLELMEMMSSLLQQNIEEVKKAKYEQRQRDSKKEEEKTEPSF